jgi:hypothetical protein
MQMFVCLFVVMVVVVMNSRLYCLTGSQQQITVSELTLTGWA